MGFQALHVTAKKGGLYFNHRDGFRYLPQGQTYRIGLGRNAMTQIETINQAREVEAHRHRFRSELIPTDDGW